MKQPKNLLAAGLALLLIACAGGYYWTRENALPRAAGKQTVAAVPSLIDARLLKTARQLAPLADTSDEQDQAREALRLADHELDLAFSTALRAAAVPDTKAATGPLQQLAARIAQLKAKVAAGQDRVAQLTAQAATKSTAADQLEFAKAQLELDQDDLDDAQQDLARQGGDRHASLEAALQQHQAAQQAAAPLSKPSPPPPASILKDQAQQWFSLNGKRAALVSAEQQAGAQASSLEREHNGLESKTAAPAPPAAAGDSDGGSPGDEDTGAVVARLRQLSDQKKTLAELDKRIQDSRQLAAAYQAWEELVETRRRAVLHLLLRSLLIMLSLVLALVVAHRVILHAFRAQDRRKRHMVEVASTIACQLIGVVAILLMAFGPPTQLSTMLGLATAGLTVVFKDFIVGFIGWFVLMTRNGVRIGDWVEINGVSGEVIEIGAFKTVLLEMGNSSNTGHPTGRRVSFSNSYAIEGHYFNFSTVGQWLWDELQVTLPATGEPYQLAEQIRQTVEGETAAAAVEAEQDWESVMHQYGVTSFSAKPAVDLKPGINGLDLVVRYITRAPQRYEVKSRLFQSIVGLLHGSATGSQPAES
jgi:small-conductance mechanosensitive channel